MAMSPLRNILVRLDGTGRLSLAELRRSRKSPEQVDKYVEVLRGVDYLRVEKDDLVPGPAFPKGTRDEPAVETYDKMLAKVVTQSMAYLRFVLGFSQIVGYLRWANSLYLTAWFADREGLAMTAADLESKYNRYYGGLHRSGIEITGQILLVPPFFESFGKRLIKSPKLYFVDSGLVCHLLGVETLQALGASPFRGPIFEGLVAAEVVKQQVSSGHARELYFFRDQQGLEVDFVVPRGAGKLWLIEAKASRTVRPSDAAGIARLATAIERYAVEAFVVHDARDADAALTTLRPGVKAVSLGQLLGRYSL